MCWRLEIAAAGAVSQSGTWQKTATENSFPEAVNIAELSLTVCTAYMKLISRCIETPFVIMQLGYQKIPSMSLYCIKQCYVRNIKVKFETKNGNYEPSIRLQSLSYIF